MVAERLVILHKLSTSFLVQATLRKWHDQQALDDFEDVLQGPLRRVPVSLQGVNADVARRHSDVRMEYLRQKESFGRALREA